MCVQCVAVGDAVLIMFVEIHAVAKKCHLLLVEQWLFGCLFSKHLRVITQNNIFEIRWVCDGVRTIQVQSSASATLVLVAPKTLRFKRMMSHIEFEFTLNLCGFCSGQVWDWHEVTQEGHMIGSAASWWGCGKRTQGCASAWTGAFQTTSLARVYAGPGRCGCVESGWKSAGIPGRS